MNSLVGHPQQGEVGGAGLKAGGRVGKVQVPFLGESEQRSQGLGGVGAFRAIQRLKCGIDVGAGDFPQVVSAGCPVLEKRAVMGVLKSPMVSSSCDAQMPDFMQLA